VEFPLYALDLVIQLK